MTSAPTLFDTYDSDLFEGPLGQQFKEHIDRHPDVERAVLEAARSIRRMGHDRYGIKAIFEALRFHSIVSGKDDSDAFKLNNNLTSRYARFLMRRHPELEGFFELRELRS